MGVDVCIYLKMRDGTKPETDLCLPQVCSIADRSYSLPDGATHEIDTVWRYYGEGYERGPWPEIAAEKVFSEDADKLAERMAAAFVDSIRSNER